MSEFDPTNYSIPGLLKCYGEILKELRQRGVLRTNNSPVGDYVEWLVAERLGLELSTTSMSGYDATGKNGDRFQIKARWLVDANPSRQLSTIRGLTDKHFDFLIAVLLDKDFAVAAAYQIPHHVIADHARFVQHVNGHNLHLQGALLTAIGVDDITHLLDVPAMPNSGAAGAAKPDPTRSVELPAASNKPRAGIKNGIHLRMVRSVGLNFYRNYIADVRDAVPTDNLLILIQRVRLERPDLDTVDYRINRMASAVRHGYDHDA